MIISFADRATADLYHGRCTTWRAISPPGPSNLWGIAPEGLLSNVYELGPVSKADIFLQADVPARDVFRTRLT